MEDIDLIEGISLGIQSENSGKPIFDSTPNMDSSEVSDKEWEKYFLNENSDYKNVNKLDVSEEILSLKKRYSDLYNFKKVADFDCSKEMLDPFIIYARDNPQLCRDVVLGTTHFFDTFKKESNPPLFEGLTLIDTYFAFIIRKNYITGRMSYYLFFNDLQKLNETFFKKDFGKHKPGIYELAVQNNKYIVKKIEISNVEHPILDENLSDKINKEISLFFENKDFYDKEKIPYKRGIILYGPPGNGKTSVVKQILNQHKDSHRLLIDCKIFDSAVADFIQQVFPEDSKKVIVFEDVESIGDGESRSYRERSSFLNFIDGAKTVTNTFFIATTNYPDMVDPALISRPSRFDRIYKIDYPSKACREKFLIRFFPQLITETENLTKYIDMTKDFSGAYFKELFIMVGIQKCTLSEAIDTLSKQIKICKEKKFDKENSRMGFGNREDY